MTKKYSLFDWSILDRDGLADFLTILSEKIVNNQLPPLELHKILSTHIKKYLPVRISKKFSDKIIPGLVFIGGTYYSDHDEEHKKCIEIQFLYNPHTELIKFNSQKFRNFAYCFADTLLHEIIHMRQYRRRKFKVLPDYNSNAEKTEQRQEQQYLGCSDEIDAYGFNIACELIEKYKNNKKEIIKHINKKQIRSKRGCWIMYLRAFDHDHNHPIIKRLKKKIIRYLPHAQEGKPYRNRDWINW